VRGGAHRHLGLQEAAHPVDRALLEGVLKVLICYSYQK
jgi:hypothetical protein